MLSPLDRPRYHPEYLKAPPAPSSCQEPRSIWPSPRRSPARHSWHSPTYNMFLADLVVLLMKLLRSPLCCRNWSSSLSSSLAQNYSVSPVSSGEIISQSWPLLSLSLRSCLLSSHIVLVCSEDFKILKRFGRETDTLWKTCLLAYIEFCVLVSLVWVRATSIFNNYVLIGMFVGKNILCIYRAI